jgi:hypothetical protein
MKIFYVLAISLSLFSGTVFCACEEPVVPVEGSWSLKVDEDIWVDEFLIGRPEVYLDAAMKHAGEGVKVIIYAHKKPSTLYSSYACPNWYSVISAEFLSGSCIHYPYKILFMNYVGDFGVKSVEEVVCEIEELSIEILGSSGGASKLFFKKYGEPVFSLLGEEESLNCERFASGYACFTLGGEIF